MSVWRQHRATVLREAADLIERRLVKTMGGSTDDRSQGMHFALTEATRLLRDEATRPEEE